LKPKPKLHELGKELLLTQGPCETTFTFSTPAAAQTIYRFSVTQILAGATYEDLQTILTGAQAEDMRIAQRNRKQNEQRNRT